MLNAIKKAALSVKNFMFKHKIISVIIILCLLVGGYWGYKSLTNTSGQTRYILAAVAKGTIISTISGTGQVSALDEINITPKTSGDLIYVGVQNGQNVVAGQTIARIDAANAQKAVDAAQINLDQAELDLKNMQGFTTDIGEKRGIKQKAQDSLDKAYEDGYNTVTSAFVSLPNIMNDFYSVLFDYDLSKNSQNIDYYANYAGTDNNVVSSQYRERAYNSYQTSKANFDNSFNVYKTTNRSSSPAEVESLIDGTYSTIKDVADAIKNSMNLIQLYQDELSKSNIAYNSTSDTHLSTLNGYTSTLNNYISSLLSVKTNIETNTENLIQTDYDLASQEQTVKDRQSTLDDAKKTLSYCSIRAPFDGTISSVNVKNGDSVSSNTTIATIVTKQKIAEISLNEIDAAKISLSQKATITFDAINGLTITGAVSEIDTLGTVSQGVVSYNAKITFDTQDDRIKPGMSMSLNIITDAKQDALIVPNSAVKTSGGLYYVLVFNQRSDLTSASASQGFISDTAPTQKAVEIGLADDTNTEIINGLSEGDQIVVRTISGTSASSSASSTSGTTNRAAQGLFIGGGGASGR